MLRSLLPTASSKAFPTEWLAAGEDRAALRGLAKKRRSSDGPRPDMMLQRAWSRATTQIAGQQLHLLTPNSGSTGRVLFYCHGGAFVIGPSTFEWLFAAKLAGDLGCDLALYDYARVPEVDSTVILDSTMAAYNAIEARYGAADMVMSGLSAGGGLAVATMLQLHRNDRELPTASVLVSPWLDMTVSHPDAASYVESDLLLPIEILRRDGELYSGSLDKNDPLVSPRFVSDTELATFPPTVVTAGEQELLLPEGRELVDRLRAVGVDSELVLEVHGQHAGVMLPTPEGKATIAAAVAYLRPKYLS